MNYLPIQDEESSTNNEENGDDFVLMPVVPNHEDKDTLLEDKEGDLVTADSQNINTDKQNITADSTKVNADSSNVIADSININAVGPSNTSDSLDNQANIKEGSRPTDVDDFDTRPDNMPLSYAVPSTPSTRVNKEHPLEKIIGDLQSGVKTRRMHKENTKHGFLAEVYDSKIHTCANWCMFAAYLSQTVPKTVAEALADESWVEAMQEELTQFVLQGVWVMVDLPAGMHVIGTKWVLKNKLNE